MQAGLQVMARPPYLTLIAAAVSARLPLLQEKAATAVTVVTAAHPAAEA